MPSSWFGRLRSDSNPSPAKDSSQSRSRPVSFLGIKSLTTTQSPPSKSRPVSFLGIAKPTSTDQSPSSSRPVSFLGLKPSNLGSLTPNGSTLTPGGSRRTHGHSRSSSQPLPASRTPLSPGEGVYTPKETSYEQEGGDYFGNAVVDLGDSGDLSLDQMNLRSNGLITPKPQSYICMCCGHTLLVPDSPKVFRCTQCLTVNDVQRSMAEEAKFNMGDKVVLSMERTRTIIDTCMKRFMDSKAAVRSPEKSSSNDIPPDSAVSVGRSKTLRPGYTRATTWTSDASPTQSTFPVLTGDGNANDGSSDESSSKHEGPLPPAVIVTSQTESPAPVPILPSGPMIGFPLQRPGMSKRSSTTRMILSTANLGESRSTIGDVPDSDGSVSTKSALRTPNASEDKDKAKRLFEPLERYMNQTYGRYDSLNYSFSTIVAPNRPGTLSRMQSEGVLRPSGLPTTPGGDGSAGVNIHAAAVSDAPIGSRKRAMTAQSVKRVTLTSPCIDWDRVDRWYSVVRNPERDWRTRHESWDSAEAREAANTAGKNAMSEFRTQLDLTVAREHAQKALFKITETLLRRPGRYIKEPEDLRFLLIILSNRLLDPTKEKATESRSSPRNRLSVLQPNKIKQADMGRDIAQHAGILKRVFGLLANSSEDCHRHLLSWFARLPRKKFMHFYTLTSAFISFRLIRKAGQKKTDDSKSRGHDFIPNLSGSAHQTMTEIHAMAGLSLSGGLNHDQDNLQYIDDWQLVSAAKVMSLLFAANNSWVGEASEQLDHHDRRTGKLPGQLLATSDFYNSVLDFQDVIADFKVWEAKKEHFSFCQYPFLLSMASKVRILNHDVRRQMDMKSREVAFYNIIGGAAHETEFNVHVRRECIVDDSLARIGEAAGNLQGELKKELKVHFAGEEGIDVGGLKKEWFLLLARDIFDPAHGLFLYDDDSHLCYFNPNTFETSDKYYLVGVLLGLAIYNSTILDVALPTFAFRKLLAAAPSSFASDGAKPGSPIASSRLKMTYTLTDLAEYRPSLAAGLAQLLAFDGDVESTFCWSFVVPMEAYGKIITHPLVPDGKYQPVTNANREEFVRLYVNLLLDTAVTRQFEPFQRGFYTVCASNSLSLFRAEELALLIRGSDVETIDVDALRGVATYDNFRSPIEPFAPVTNPARDVPVVRWFWEYFRSANGPKQRSILQFITASDRVPACGAAGVTLRIVAGGDGTGLNEEEDRRFPVARTCFNSLTLWGWKSRGALAQRFDEALAGSEGFGLR